MTLNSEIASRQNTTNKDAEVASALAALNDLTVSELRTAWQRHYKKPPPQGISRDLLLRAAAYGIQERAYGGLSKATIRRLKATARAIAVSEGKEVDPYAALKPGTQLLREWRGTSYTVLVLEDGFEYGGQRYTSLSLIAKAISGLHRSGPAFFGLKRQAAPFADDPRRLKRKAQVND